jgi:lipopolysaccharide/colanic/teichoic acid biosynthesis glycosyltransferase
VLDRTVAALLLVGLSPLLLVIALAVIASGPGPVIFRQRRQGWLRRDFVLLKFRTMRHEPGGPTRRMQTRRNDPRCTPVGRFLRAFSLDELPQLWNVLRGEMSLVGPRPHVDGLHVIVKAGQVLLAEYAKRYRVRPGITGWAQVNGLRGATATADQLRRRLEYDLYYIENWSLLFDLKILVLTPFAMAGENAF